MPPWPAVAALVPGVGRSATIAVLHTESRVLHNDGGCGGGGRPPAEQSLLRSQRNAGVQSRNCPFRHVLDGRRWRRARHRRCERACHDRCALRPCRYARHAGGSVDVRDGRVVARPRVARAVAGRGEAELA